MTVLSPARAGHSPAAALPPAKTAPGVTVRRVAASEWIKLRSLRSTVFLLTAAALGLVGGGAFAAVGVLVSGTSRPDPATVDPLGGSLSGLPLVELIVLVLGALAVTGEYASGAIRATFTAVPRRVQVLVSKAVVVAATVFTVTLVATVLAFLAAQAVLRTGGVSISLTAPGVPRAIVGAALYLAVISLFGVGFGWLVRSTAGALASVFGVLYVLPVVGIFLPGEIAQRVVPLFPSNAGNAVVQVGPSGLLPPWVGLALFTAYAAVLLIVAALVLRRRDA